MTGRDTEHYSALIKQAEEILRIAEDAAKKIGRDVALRVARRRWLVDLSNVVQEWSYSTGCSIVSSGQSPGLAVRDALIEWLEHHWGEDEGDEGEILDRMAGPIVVYEESFDLFGPDGIQHDDEGREYHVDEWLEEGRGNKTEFANLYEACGQEWTEEILKRHFPKG